MYEFSRKIILKMIQKFYGNKILIWVTQLLMILSVSIIILLIINLLLMQTNPLDLKYYMLILFVLILFIQAIRIYGNLIKHDNPTNNSAKLQRNYNTISRLADNRKFILIGLFSVYAGLSVFMINNSSVLNHPLIFAKSIDSKIKIIFIMIIIHNHLNYIINAGKQYETECPSDNGKAKIFSVWDYLVVIWDHIDHLWIEIISFSFLIILVLVFSNTFIWYIGLNFKEPNLLEWILGYT